MSYPGGPAPSHGYGAGAHPSAGQAAPHSMYPAQGRIQQPPSYADTLQQMHQSNNAAYQSHPSQMHYAGYREAHQASPQQNLQNWQLPTYAQPEAFYPQRQPQPHFEEMAIHQQSPRYNVMPQLDGASDVQRRPSQVPLADKQPHQVAAFHATNASQMQLQAPSGPIDAATLLLSLAEEYLEMAHSIGRHMAADLHEEDVNTYQKLISTALGCLESLLKNCKLPPRTEAIARLRYVGVLCEETENFMEAETALSKGISLCERVGI